MECFGDYHSDDFRCAVCWLRDCCKFSRNDKEQKILDKIRGDELTIPQFDGVNLSKLKAGYNRSLTEFLNQTGSTLQTKLQIEGTVQQPPT